jgi:hypothetical protein
MLSEQAVRAVDLSVQVSSAYDASLPTMEGVVDLALEWERWRGWLE